jgi:hypothetical protein
MTGHDEGKRTMRRVLLSIIVSMAMLPGTLILAPAAQAIGTVNKQCTHYDTATGYSSSTNGGFTTNAGVCGEAKVRLAYKLHTGAGALTYFTAWTYSKTTALRAHPGNIVLGGSHGVSNPAGCCSSAKNFES